MDPLFQQPATNMEDITNDKPKILLLKQIGDPEKVKNYENVTQGGESKSLIRKSVHIFRKPRVEHQARLLS